MFRPCIGLLNAYINYWHLQLLLLKLKLPSDRDKLRRVVYPVCTGWRAIKNEQSRDTEGCSSNLGVLGEDCSSDLGVLGEDCSSNLGGLGEGCSSDLGVLGEGCSSDLGGLGEGCSSELGVLDEGCSSDLCEGEGCSSN